MDYFQPKLAMTHNTLADQFNDADRARDFLESRRWPKGVTCPHCGTKRESYRLNPIEEQTKKGTHVRKGVWKCARCRKQFTVTVGTIFENSHIPLNKWLLAIHLLGAGKKGINAHHLHRLLRVTYKSARFMVHRIPYAMTQEKLDRKLYSLIEGEETNVGGKRKRTAETVGPNLRPTDRP